MTGKVVTLWDTQTPLLTNSLQLAGRAAIVALLLDREGAIAIPIALAVTASTETVGLGVVLAVKVRRRMLPV